MGADRRDQLTCGRVHHTEIVDRLLRVLEEKRQHGDVTEEWYRERSHTLESEMRGDIEEQSRLTSEYTLMGPLRYHVERLVGVRDI